MTANGTITSGRNSAVNGGSAGILAGYNGAINGPFVPNLAVTGTVLVNNSANITAAAGWGIDVYNYGNGNVTVNDTALTVSGAQTGIGAISIAAAPVTSRLPSEAALLSVALTGISAVTMGSGTIKITDQGTVTGSSPQAIYVYMGAAGTATLDNDGTINGALTLANAAFTLDLIGTGTVALDGQSIVAMNTGEILDNEGNTISGYGLIGLGTDSDLTFINAATVDADVAGHSLILSTGNIITNSGVLRADGSLLQVSDAVTGAGSAIIANGGTLELHGADAQTVTFSDANGTLILDDPSLFTGNVAHAGGTFDTGNIIDLRALSSTSTDTFATSTSYDSVDNTTLLTVTDSTQGTHASVTLDGDQTTATWTATFDGNGVRWWTLLRPNLTL